MLIYSAYYPHIGGLKKAAASSIYAENAYTKRETHMQIIRMCRLKTAAFATENSRKCALKHSHFNMRILFAYADFCVCEQFSTALCRIFEFAVSADYTLPNK